MSIKATLSSDGVEETYTAPTLKEMCLYKCLTNKDILTKEVEVDEATSGSEKLAWEKFRLKEPIQRDLVEALLDAGDKYMFLLSPKYEPVLAAIRMNQPEHLVKVHVSNTITLEDRQLEFLIGGGNVKSLDIHGCHSLTRGTLIVINKFGNKLEYLRIGDSFRVLPHAVTFNENSAILRTPNLKSFIVSDIDCDSADVTNYWKFLLQDFISNLEDLQISRTEEFQTLEFLEPAKSKLSSLVLRNCVVEDNANAWASLFKLDKLRSLDLVGSLIGDAFVDENVVRRLLTAMPNLTHLAFDPMLVEDIYVDTSIRGQGSAAKRLKFLGIMDIDDDTTELIKAKLLANDVANFGTVEGELCILEYYSNHLNSGFFDSMLERLLKSLSEMATTPPCKSVTVISLFMKTFKNNGVSIVLPKLFFQTLKKLLVADVPAKLGEVLLDQMIGTISAFISKCSEVYANSEPEIINDVIDIMMHLDGELCFDHYITVVPRVMRVAETAMTKQVLDDIGMADFKDLLKNIAQLLEKAADRFPEEPNALWGISSVLVVIKELKDVMLSVGDGDRAGLLEIFSSMITSLKQLCLNSGPLRLAFHSAKGIDIVMELLRKIIDGSLGFADRDSFALLEILKSILLDTKVEFLYGEYGEITSSLEYLFLSFHYKWQFWKGVDSDRETKHYLQVESLVNLFNYLESHPRFDYKTSVAVKGIMMKLK